MFDMEDKILGVVSIYLHYICYTFNLIIFTFILNIWLLFKCNLNVIFQ